MRNRLVVAGLLCLCLLESALASDRPNVVWILSEDNSIHYLRHFFEGGAETPRIEAMAASGLTFRHAFSNAPVCSVARTTLMTSCYAPRILTQFHRRYKLAPMPDGLSMFPRYLRDAGYYTTNNRKKDYNAVEGEGVWDDSSGSASWRNRPDPEQPFFHMESHGDSHEGSLHFDKQTIERAKTTDRPEEVALAEYHPDTPTFRFTHAFYLDRIRRIDQKVGQTIDRLRQDGLLEETFVFYFGDHGGVLPRSKGYVYDSGLHVPLVIRVPQKFTHLVDHQRGSSIDGFVSFVDFGPTVLNLAGLETPAEVDGRPFLGEGVRSSALAKRDTSFGYADRFDEKYDLVRTIRRGKWQYVRSFQPYLPDGLNNNYRYKCLAFAEWRQRFYDGKLSESTAQFFRPKPTEMLFDCESDPHQVHNLAGSSRHSEMLVAMRDALREQMLALPDLSLYPESYLLEHAIEDPVAFGSARQEEVRELMQIADLALVPFAKAENRLQESLKSPHQLHRYWAAMVCTSFGDEARSLIDDAKRLVDDEDPLVRLRAVEFLARVGGLDSPQSLLIEIVNSTNDPVIATEVLNSIVWLRDFFDGKYPVERSQFRPIVQGGDVEDRLNYINGNPYPGRP